MSRSQRILAAVAAVAALVCATAVVEFTMPSPAHASSTQVSMLMDDDQLIYVPTSHMVQTLQRLASLGVDVVKVSVVWQLIAPNASSAQRPNFDATNPAAYPPGAWNRYDTLVQTAQRLGLKVYFLVIGPAPVWAIPPGNRTSQGPNLGWAPDPNEYRQFVEAVGRRYSGAYVDPSTPAGGAGVALPSVSGVTVPTTTTSAPVSDPAQPLPRVNYWGIWNEPNERSWLNPWYRNVPHHGRALIQPELYRGLVDAAWRGLQDSSHGSDTIMIGETANRGVLAPVPFVRELYCVGANLRPLRGGAASSVGCPTSGPASSFVSQHPGLFAAGYAHHPYAFDIPPNRPYPDRTFVTLYDLPSFERLLERVFGDYGQRPAGGVPIYLTEWGYKTNPPNPYITTTLAQQAAWLNEGEYITWREPYVRSLTQFLLVDSPPKPGARKNSVLYWSTFQTGLETMQGNPKPSFDAFRVPIWLPSARHGRSVAVWGQLRPAAHNTTQYGVIEFERRGSSSWRELAEVQTDSPEGFVYDRVSIPSAGTVRLGWLDPSGTVYYSRPVSVS